MDEVGTLFGLDSRTCPCTPSITSSLRCQGLLPGHAHLSFKHPGFFGAGWPFLTSWEDQELHVAANRAWLWSHQVSTSIWHRPSRHEQSDAFHCFLGRHPQLNIAFVVCDWRKDLESFCHLLPSDVHEGKSKMPRLSCYPGKGRGEALAQPLLRQSGEQEPDVPFRVIC